ncbi:MAG: peptidoglycan-binding protein [Candidatus Buchananbacteria bacterium]
MANKHITFWFKNNLCRFGLSTFFLALIFYPQSNLFAVESTTTLPTLVETEQQVRTYFADIPAMISIAKCESGFRQYNNDGTPLLGSNLYIGIFQIDKKIHTKIAADMGMDIYTVEGNLAYAKYLYTQLGTKPWAGCVKNTEPTYFLTKNLKLGDTNTEVKTLQKTLNQIGFFVAKSGNGSLGQETTTFGQMTKNAVKRFQCANKIICQGSETTTGYGLVGPRTRALLLQSVK